jgi:alkylation response protein AidB-like acyl-CoA dehydrogenase
VQRTLYDDDHKIYRASVRTFLEKEVVPHYGDWEKAGIVSRDVFAAAARLGAFDEIPEQYGGSGRKDFRYNVILGEEAAQLAVTPAAMGLSLEADIVMPYLLTLTNDEQKQRWLPGIARGELIVAIAMTEPGTGSDLAGIKTRAVRQGDHYIVDGAKTFITNGINADLVLTVVRTSEHPHRGLSLLMIERGTRGFERGRNLEKVGMHAQDTAELSFIEACVPASNLVGAEGQGFIALTRNLARERMACAAGAVAGAAAALNWTIDYVRERTAFGAPLGALQHTRFTLGELATEIDIAQQFVDACVIAENAGVLDAVDAAKAKWWTTELQGRVVDRCVQLHGGYGYMLEYPIARSFLDSRVSRIYAGSNEIMKEIIGRSLDLS